MWDKADVGPGSALSKFELGTEEHSPIDNNRNKTLTTEKNTR